jgi:hypothetical protein
VWFLIFHALRLIIFNSVSLTCLYQIMANAADDSGRGMTAANTHAPGGGAAVGTEALTKPFYRRIVEKFVSTPPAKEQAVDALPENATAVAPSIVPATAFGQPAAQLDPAAIARIQRDAIDASYFAELERKAVKAIKDPKRKLMCRLSISQNDEEWITQREKLRALLASTSIRDVLDTEFEAAQKSLFVPSVVDGPLLEVQLQNAKQYKDLFKPGARFHGTPDNMLTKLTMLKFGLPIEALTETNLSRCDNRVDEDDPPDSPGPDPPLERILYSQRPLEFLDSYNERSFGYPMMRRKSQSPNMLLARLMMDQGQSLTICLSRLLVQRILQQEALNQIQLYQHKPPDMLGACTIIGIITVLDPYYLPPVQRALEVGLDDLLQISIWTHPDTYMERMMRKPW